ncbi:MAG: toll/interleukin-1 receptor domain-containing protein, partial [Gammaproteobacteria bacterium]
ATPEVVHSGWVRQEYAAFQRRRQADPAFRLIPIAFGELPNLPFLADIQAVDFRDPSRYRECLHRLLCGLDGREPGPDAKLPYDIPPPPPLRPVSGIVPGERGFLQRVERRLNRATTPPLLIVSRGQRYQGPVIQALLDSIRAGYGAEVLFHMTPPYSEQISHEAYFRELGRQCGFAADTGDSTAFAAAFDRQLQHKGRLFLLISGFENATEPCRRELAGTLRSLTEKRPADLRVVLFGGQKLLEQKYGAGTMSFLSHATVEEWPDPDVADVLAWQREEFPGAALDETAAQALLDAAGRHPGLVRYCLERGATSGDPAEMHDWFYSCPELWDTWYRLARHDPERFDAALSRDTFGPVLTWPPDIVTRKLYWADCLVGRAGRLAWRAEVVRQVGREVLAA